MANVNVSMKCKEKNLSVMHTHTNSSAHRENRLLLYNVFIYRQETHYKN